MIIGYILSGGSSNEAEFFDGTEPAGTLCAECGSCLNPLFFPKYLKVHRSKKYDVCYTHDLRTLFSERFVAFLKDDLGCEEDFHLIKTDYFSLYYCFPREVVPFDYEKRETRFIGACSTCGGYKEVIGATPAYTRLVSPLGPGLFRTDLAFSSGRSKQPFILIGAEWQQAIKAKKFRGVTFHFLNSSTDLDDHA